MSILRRVVEYIMLCLHYAAIKQRYLGTDLELFLGHTIERNSQSIKQY